MTEHEDLIAALSLEDKVRLCAGADVWRTHGVAEHGIPPLKLSDGPRGLRGTSFAGARSTGFPCGSAIGATFDVELAARLGDALAAEAQAKGVSVLLGPTVNLHRTPLAGRNFECFSEDPHLTTHLATTYIRSLQSHGVAACIKHFVANDAEFQRTTISSDVDARPLHELYLRPFEDAVQAGVWAVMTSYNRINGVFAAENAELVRDLLKGQWGFDGYVISDWFGTYSTAPSAHAGLDLEMPGPPNWFDDQLAVAVAKGEIAEEVIDDKVRRLLRLVERTGGLARAPEQPEPTTDSPEHRTLARDLAAGSFVMLRNEPAPGGTTPILPLRREELATVAVVGPNAVRTITQGGGSSHVHDHPTPTPAEAIAAVLDGIAKVVVEAGAHHGRDTVLLEGELLDGSVTLTYHPLGRPDQPALHTEQLDTFQMIWFGDPPGPVGSNAFTVVARASLAAGLPGPVALAVGAGGTTSLRVDGEEMPAGDVAIRGGAEIELRYDRGPDETLAGVNVTCTLPDDPGRRDRAVAAARSADVAVVVVGTDAQWESEGHDRTTLALPGDQDELVRAIVAANPNTIVVVNAGAPVALPWAEEVPAVLLTWFPGVEGPAALAEVLFGDREPGGRLPVTFPRRIEDTPTFTTDPGEAGHLRYGEGIFVGYRWYDRRDIEPAFPFGFGLGYTTIRYDGATLDGNGAVTVTATNTGDRAGSDVVQVYVRRPAGELAQPARVLAGFVKAHLSPGETRHVTVPIDERSISSWHPDHGWTTVAGKYVAEVGSSSRAIHHTVKFHVEES